MISKLTLDEVRSSTHFAERRCDDFLTKAENLGEDRQAYERHKAQECLWCYYVAGNRIVGQAFTNYHCKGCYADFAHHNTGVPALCADCAKNHRLCRQCGADLDYKNRRAL
jgi:hypothetical protein